MGPRNGEGDGMTAKVRLIISRTDAIDPRVLAPLALLTRLVLSSSTLGRLEGRAVPANVWREF
jgi:hypothetical protein